MKKPAGKSSGQNSRPAFAFFIFPKKKKAAESIRKG
jgi:hypothetical protein